MRRSRRRVFVDSVVRREVARDKVDAVGTGCRDDRIGSHHLAHRREVGPERRHILGALIDGQGAAAGDKAPHRRFAECCENPRIGCFLLRRPAREVHRQQIAVAHHFERPGL